MGTYLEITSVSMVSEAEAGSAVYVWVKVRNKWDQVMTAAVTMALDGIAVQGGAYDIGPGEWSWPRMQFTMPNKSINGMVSAFFATHQPPTLPEHWYEDDRKTVSVSLAGASQPPDEPSYAGQIESPTVEVGGTHYSVPRLLSYGEAFRLGFMGRNHSSVNVRLWGSINIKRPGGQSAYYGEALEAITGTGPGGTHQFIFPMKAPSYQAPATVDGYGVWRADMELRAGGASGVLLEKKTNVHVFTCEEPPDEDEPDYSGYINPVQVRTGPVANFGAAPKTVSQGTDFSISFTVFNQSAVSLVLKGAFELKWPSAGRVQVGSDRTGPALIEETVAPGGSHSFSWNSYPQVNPFTADEAGDYTVKFRLYGKKKGEPESAYRELCSPREGKVLTVTAAADPPGPGDPGSPEPGVYAGEIRNLIIRWENLSGRDIPIPVAGEAPVGEAAKIAYTGYNLSDRNLHITSEMWVGSPSNPNKYHYGPHTPYRLGGYSPGTGPDFIWPGGDPLSAFRIDEAGEWSLKITLTSEVDGVKYLLDEYDGPLFTASEQADMWGTLADIMPLMMIMMMFGMVVPMMKDIGGELEAGDE